MNYSIDRDFGLRRRTKWALVGLGAIAIIWGTAAPAEAQYFKGKTIEVIVPAGAGGGLTRNARRFVQNFGKHIAGNPTVIIKNMVGGGGQRGINHVYQNGKKDGTTLMWGPLNLAGIVAGLRGIKYSPPLVPPAACPLSRS
jgi:tripartite-type tricarboxylate transporter receptor subunit TctC